jgi:glutaredoxin 2
MTRSSFQENATEAARKAYIERETAAVGDLNVLFNDTPTLLAQIAPLLGGSNF